MPKKSRRLNEAYYMPPLSKKPFGDEYKPEKDETIQWMSNQPDLMNFLFDVLKDRKYIIYNPETKKWQGARYE